MVHQVLKPLLLHPRIEVMDDGAAFYHDQFTGESIKKRVGLPGSLVLGKACKKENAQKMYGSFRNFNVLVAFILHNKAELVEEYANALISWVNTQTKQTVIPAPARNMLSLHEGRMTFDEYHKKYQEVETGAIVAKQELNERLSQQPGQSEEEPKQKPVANSVKMMSAIKRDAEETPDDVVFYAVAVCPKYDMFCCWGGKPDLYYPEPPLTLFGREGKCSFISCAAKMSKKLRTELEAATKRVEDGDQSDDCIAVTDDYMDSLPDLPPTQTQELAPKRLFASVVNQNPQATVVPAAKRAKSK